MAVTPHNDTTHHSSPPSAAVMRRGAPQRLSKGDRIGLNYVIDELIGRGGMAEVYRALHEGLGTAVALKVLQESHERKQHIVRGLQREARLLASMPKHDHLVRVFDSAEDPARKLFFVVMELLDGKNLREYMDMRIARSSPFSIREAVTIAITIANTLYDLHAAKYYHRDLKPENVFIQKRQGNTPAMIKLLDLGAALAPSMQDLRTEDEARCVGTPMYMSPEQIMSGTITERSDIYALGMILYELLRGRHAWSDRDVDARMYVAAVGALQLYEMPAKLTDCVPGMPPELDAIVMKMVAKDPKDRFESGHAVAHELSMFLKQAKNALKEARATGKDLFVEAIINAPPSTGRAGDPYSGIAHAPPSTTRDAPPPATNPEVGALDPTIPQHRALAAPVQAAPNLPTTLGGTVKTPQGLLASVGLDHLNQTGPAPAARGKHTMRIEIGGGGVRALAVPGVGGALRLNETLTSPDEPPDSDGVQSSTLRELLPRLPARDGILQVDSLVVVEGPARLLGLRYPIEFVALKIGRAREANIVIPHVTVSRMHCGVFAITEGVFEVVDTGSSYGIEVNDLSTHRATLRARGRLRVGDVVLQLVRARTQPPELRESRVFNSVALDPSITAYVSDAIHQTGGFSRATIASSKDRGRFERAATALPPAPGNDTISNFALGKASMSLSMEGVPAPSSRALDPTRGMEIGRFTPGPAALLRGGPNPWRQSEAKLTHDYFDATFPPALKTELQKGNRASLDHLMAEQPNLAAAGMKERLADCLFMMNEHAARLELLSGAPGGKVYQERLASPRDWDGAAKTIVDRVIALKARERQSRVVVGSVLFLFLVGIGVLVYMLVLRPK